MNADYKKRKQNSPLPGDSRDLSENSQRAINSMILQGTACGISSFLLGYRDFSTGQMLVHFQNLPVGDAINLINQAWLMAMDEVVLKHPEYAPEFKKIFSGGKGRFLALIASLNKEVAEYEAKNKK